MATTSLSLYRCADGYFRTSWIDDGGRQWSKSFGKTPAKARERFNTFHHRWQSDRAVRNPDNAQHFTVQKAWEKFKVHAEAYYVNAQGEQTGEAENFAHAMKPVLDLYGESKLREFAVSHLKRVRTAMVEARLCVNVINARVRKIRQVWKWLVQEEMVEASAWHSLQALSALPKGRPVSTLQGMMTPRVSDDVKPVPDQYVAQVAASLPKTLAAMVWFQYYTGARPGEVCQLRPIDLNTSGKVWIFRPARHKTQHHGKSRTILIGPKAQAVIQSFISRDLNAPFFSPAEAWTQRHDQKTEGKRYAKWASYQARKAARVGRGGDRYHPKAYARAIARACEDLGLPQWSPNQLRHNAATRLRKEFGLDVAQVALGHSKADITEVYAELDLEKAVKAMEAVG